ncbi:thiamine phosphate synthase [Candidatus Pelagibacter bacterium]|jgi:thiamine-phosphate pyrophosphorylase|nr:thiamine phosphate synthase [Candidatus Pelagibacter bacterium]
MHILLPKVFYFISEFKKDYIRKLDKKIAIIYRNYNNKNIYNEVLKIKEDCKKHNRKFYISNNIKLAIKLKLDGAYIPSFNRDITGKKKLRKNFILLGSAHNYEEIRIKEKQGVDLIFLSPLFLTKDKKKILGINRFNLLANQTKKKVIALGGINANNIKKLNLTKSYGFASISLIKDNYRSMKSLINKY